MSQRKTSRPVVRARRVRVFAISVSIALNGLVIWALLQSRPTIAPAVPQAMDVVILPPVVRFLAPRPAAVQPQPKPRKRREAEPVGVAPQVVAPLIRLPGPPVAAPPAAAAPSAVDAGVARTLRRKMGCQQAKLMGLTEAEQQACQDAFAAGAKTAPLYPVISDKEKQIFDGTYCPPDDEWCLYRMGRAPYPGLISLMRKHRH